MRLFVEGTGDLAGAAALLARITARHEERMEALGLSRPRPAASIPAGAPPTGPVGR
jgi:hypothetical protein